METAGDWARYGVKAILTDYVATLLDAGLRDLLNRLFPADRSGSVGVV